MCGPSALLGLSAAGAGASAGGAYSNSVASRGAYNQNAQMDEYAAQQAQKRGDQLMQQQYIKTAQLKGAQRARLAANGGDLGVGSPLDILTSTDVMGATDANTIRDNTNAEVYGHRVSEANNRAAAKSQNPWASAFTSLLGGAGTVAAMHYNFKKQGLGVYGQPAGN